MRVGIKTPLFAGPNVMTAPLAPKWDFGAGVAISDEALASLGARYGDQQRIHENVLRAIVAGTESVNQRRDEQERRSVDVVKAMLLAADPEQEKVAEFLNSHRDRVKNPANFILTLSKLATTTSVRGMEQSLGFDVFGENQCGLWDTPSSDIRLKELRDELDELGVLTNDYADKNPALVSYRFRPFGNDEVTEEGIRNGRHFGTVRRRRPVADVGDLKLFKESNALVVCPYLPEDILDRVIPALTLEAGSEHVAIPDDISQLVGGAFETGINEEKGETLDIVPLTTHVIAMLGHVTCRS